MAISVLTITLSQYILAVSQIEKPARFSRETSRTGERINTDVFYHKCRVPGIPNYHTIRHPGSDTVG